MTQENGWAIISMFDNGGEYRVPRTDFERILAEWMAGKAFIRFTTLDGGDITVKASRVEAVADMTADAVEAWRERNREDRREQEREF